MISISRRLLMTSTVWATSTDRGLYFLLKFVSCWSTSNSLASFLSKMYFKVLSFNFYTIRTKAFFYSTTSTYRSFSWFMSFLRAYTSSPMRWTIYILKSILLYAFLKAFSRHFYPDMIKLWWAICLEYWDHLKLLHQKYESLDPPFLFFFHFLLFFVFCM